MDKQFNIGDQVRLKSGGPVMTVDSIDDNTSRLVCVWFDSKKVFQHAKFIADTLEKYEPSSSVPGIYFA
ncbi:DUF2158 domain-containing protein [Mucilaginibacter sp. RS28]|uniref:DUF2158 domain-containing protein n=1 Tax=Mucilaginibacter straminoryzae TaxID=2932774 RepID=A0A9X1X7Q7_9SPHI|nr:DUF2158 domain-containing protein [Mucilaginibacter straminoryzae]MCJ8211705.1 DUF2158 domain-containing protein [Mucilaginibacter straminoryzae]